MKWVHGRIAPVRFVSRPARGAWIEILQGYVKPKAWKSRPARGAWIEMC